MDWDLDFAFVIDFAFVTCIFYEQQSCQIVSTKKRNLTVNVDGGRFVLAEPLKCKSYLPCDDKGVWFEGIALHTFRVDVWSCRGQIKAECQHILTWL